MREEALDRPLSRIGFRKAYGPVLKTGYGKNDFSFCHHKIILTATRTIAYFAATNTAGVEMA